jgi:hypothetical protein
MIDIEAFSEPKQLPDALLKMGVERINNVRAVRALAKAMKADGMPCISRNWLRPVDAKAWLKANPEWHPFPRKPFINNGLGCKESADAWRTITPKCPYP